MRERFESHNRSFHENWIIKTFFANQSDLIWFISETIDCSLMMQKKKKKENKQQQKKKTNCFFFPGTSNRQKDSNWKNTNYSQNKAKLCLPVVNAHPFLCFSTTSKYVEQNPEEATNILSLYILFTGAKTQMLQHGEGSPRLCIMQNGTICINSHNFKCFLSHGICWAHSWEVGVWGGGGITNQPEQKLVALSENWTPVRKCAHCSRIKRSQNRHEVILAGLGQRYGAPVTFSSLDISIPSVAPVFSCFWANRLAKRRVSRASPVALNPLGAALSAYNR